MMRKFIVITLLQLVSVVATLTSDEITATMYACTSLILGALAILSLDF